MTDSNIESAGQNTSDPPADAQESTEPTEVNVQVNLQVSNSGAATLRVLVNGSQVTDLDFQTLPAGGACGTIVRDYID
jgi:hypothetical protein